MPGPLWKSVSISVLRFVILAISIQTVVISSLAQAKPNAKDLLRQMTLEEKIGRCRNFPAFLFRSSWPNSLENLKTLCASTGQAPYSGFPSRKK